MKKITFKKITIKNFLSVGPEEVCVTFKEGLNVITGYNRDEEDIRNGCGKTTIIEAFYFAIFGNVMKDLPKQFIVNRKVGKGCLVRLEWENQTSSRGTEYFVIERSLGPNKLKIWKNDVEKTKSTIPETNKYIKEVLEADEEIFQNCIIMRANCTIPFMSKKKTDKKNFIESIFNLSIFSEMQKLLREDVKGVRRQYDIENTAFELLKKNHQNYTEQIENLKIQESTAEQRYNEEIQGAKTKIAKQEDVLRLLKTDGVQLKEKYSQFKNTDQSLRTKIKDCIRQVDQKNTEIFAVMHTLETEFKKISKMGDVCPTCGKPYDKSECDHRANRMNEIQQELQKYKAVQDKISRKRSELSTSLQKEETTWEEYLSVQNQAKILKEKIENAERILAVYKQHLDSIKINSGYENSIKAFEELLEKCSSDIEERKTQVDLLEKELSKMNVCEFILSDMGVRKFIVGKLLELLNSRIRYYLKAFKSTFSFTFDDQFDESIKDSNGIICLYNNCSGAEAKKIDLAISFSFLDILKFHQQVEYNVQFYDEILDSSVDNKSLETIIEFITEQALENSKSVYIVTHKQDLNLPQVTETIVVEKVNGYTKRCES